MKKLITICCGLLLWQSVSAGIQPAWKSISEAQAFESGKREINVTSCNYFEMDPVAMRAYLDNAPLERTGVAGIELVLPSAFGGLMRFEVVLSPVMEAGLAEKFPMIKTWSGRGIDDRSASIRLDITQWGFHAMIMSSKGTEFIDPLNLQTQQVYMSYKKADARRSAPGNYHCGFDPNSEENKQRQNEILEDVAKNRGTFTQRSIGSSLETYRLALACTGEYASVFGGTVPGALSAMTTSVNRINQVYEKELCIHFNLVANNDTLVFTNSSTDPYTNNSGSTMLGQNQSTVTTRIGVPNYDVGHVFSTGGGGIAHLGCVCISSNKARGVTGGPNPVGDAFDIDYVAHEMGHQFGGNHSFNGTSGSCSTGNNSTAYEPGSGSTIMAYAGICSPQNVQNNSDDYFHVVSFDEIQDFITLSSGNICNVSSPTGNNAPSILSTTSNYPIPLLTPFRLTGSAFDPDGDALTYCWEQYDLGPSGNPNTPTGNAPLFRSIEGSADSVRMFPKLATILLGFTNAGYERLPTYARNMKFRLTVRDNRSGGGGVTYENVATQLNVINTTTAFEVTTANAVGVSFPALSQQTINWNVSSTDLAPINTSSVNILLSTDGGMTFPIVLASAVPNTGSAVVTIPNNQTTTARIMIEPVGNVYFDICNKNFTIGAPQSLFEMGIPGESIQVFPNPMSDRFNWSMTGKYRGEGTVKLTDVSGAVVYNTVFDKQDASLQQVIETVDLAAGVYMLHIETPTGYSVSKLVHY